MSAITAALGKIDEIGADGELDANAFDSFSFDLDGVALQRLELDHPLGHAPAARRAGVPRHRCAVLWPLTLHGDHACELVDPLRPLRDVAPARLRFVHRPRKALADGDRS